MGEYREFPDVTKKAFRDTKKGKQFQALKNQLDQSRAEVAAEHKTERDIQQALADKPAASITSADVDRMDGDSLRRRLNSDPAFFKRVNQLEAEAAARKAQARQVQQQEQGFNDMARVHSL